MTAGTDDSIFSELKRYVGFTDVDELSLTKLHAVIAPDFQQIVELFYDRILSNDGARRVLEAGESTVGRLKVTLVAWLDELLRGPWDEAYFERRCRIGRMHVRINMPQHYMFGAMNVLRQQLMLRITRHHGSDTAAEQGALLAMGKILDLELAVMLHTYREDLLTQQSRQERLATFGQLVGSLGHELRNPLGVIESSLFILKNRLGEDVRYDKHVTRIGEQVGIANKIISDLLDMIREKDIPRTKVSLAGVVDAAVDRVRRPESMTLGISGLAGLPEISGDEGQLQQVFVNLIENAVQATAPGGRIDVVATSDDAAVEIAIEDNGPGVDADTRRRLFEPLVTTKTKGVGLGLALVKRIVERHGGLVRYEPNQPVGARFIVRLRRD